MLTDVSLYSLNVVGGSREALRRFVQAFIQYIFDFVIAVAAVNCLYLFKKYLFWKMCPGKGDVPQQIRKEEFYIQMRKIGLPCVLFTKGMNVLTNQVQMMFLQRLLDGFKESRFILLKSLRARRSYRC